MCFGLQIIGLQLAPGTSLSRPALAESFGVSQTPVRDALRKLEQEGLVIVHPQSSTLVAPIDIGQAHETQFLRTALECEVARTITAAPGDFDLRPAELVLDEMEAIWTKHQDAPPFGQRTRPSIWPSSERPAASGCGNSSFSAAATSTGCATST